MSNHQFVAMWDCYGLECLVDVTEAQGQKVWANLKGDSNLANFMPNLMHLKLRASYNSQRHYEIYLFEAVDGITREDILEMFEASPQDAADTIRRIGYCYHSDRREEHKIAIR